MTTNQQRFYVRANGIKLHYLEFGGDGPPLLVIPGITSPAMIWAFVGERLAETHRVYILDNRGRGLSERYPGMSYSVDDYAADAAGVIEALGLDRPAVLGHSMGARIVARLAATTADKVGRALLIDPPVSGPGRRPYPFPIPPYLADLDATSQGLPSAPRPGWPSDRVAERAQWLPTCDRDAVIESYERFHSEDMHGDLPGIACPTLLLYAELQGVVTDADAEEISALLQHGSTVRIDGVGHMIPWDDLDAFVAAVTEFLATAT